MSEPLDRLAPAEPSDPPALPQGGTAAASAGPSSARRVGWVAILVILIVASAVAWKVMGAGSTSSNERAQGAPAASIPVAVMKVARGEVARYEVFEGEFLPFQQVELHPEIAGFLTAISVDEGDRVKDKQVLAILDVPGLDEDIARSRAQAEHDAHVIATAEATFEQNHQTYLRLFGVSQQQAHLIAEQDIDAAKALDLSSQGTWKAAVSQEAASKAETAKLLIFKQCCTITAPFAGIVTRRYVDTGALVEGGVAAGVQATPLIQLSQEDLLRLSFPVTESLVALIHAGLPAHLHVDAVHDDIQTSVTRVRSKVDEATRTMEVQIDVPNPLLLITPGMYASVQVCVDRHVDVLILPHEAIRRRAGTHLVYVVGADDQVQERPITIGIENPESIEVLSGVTAGELVVYGNLDIIQPGQRVDPKPVSLTGGAHAP